MPGGLSNAARGESDKGQREKTAYVKVLRWRNIPGLLCANKNKALLEFVNAEKPATDDLNGRQSCSPLVF